VSQLDDNGESFYEYAMELFSDAGHVATSTPVFSNHSPERFLYFDNRQDLSITPEQRQMFTSFNNISRLFKANGRAFFSINLLATKETRSQVARDIHSMIHPYVEARGTICLFRFEDEYLFSFIGFALQCILSDWYRISDDDLIVLEKLDIANMSIKKGKDYFLDMIYMFARYYYLKAQPSDYDLLPIDFLSNSDYDGTDWDELNKIAEDILTAPQREYGSDYVDYGATISPTRIDLSAELDLMLLDLDDEEDNPFGEDTALEGDDLYTDKYYDETQDGQPDEYEYDDVDPEIFRDPVLMVKWLEKNNS